MAELQARMEERWCNEAVPALGGLTPRQAAGDPTRREALERLLVEFDQHEDDLPAGVFSFRTARLRRLLGLS